MRRRTKITVLVGLMLVGAFVVFMGVGGFAASSSGAISVNAGVAPTIQLTTGSNVNFGNVVPGTPVSSSTTMTVNSNKGWGMTVTRDGELQSAGGTYKANAGDLKYTSSNGGDSRIKGLQTTAIPFGTGTNVCSGCDRGSGEVVNISYALNLSNWDIPDGTALTASHTYTASND